MKEGFQELEVKSEKLKKKITYDSVPTCFTYYRALSLPVIASMLHP